MSAFALRFIGVASVLIGVCATAASTQTNVAAPAGYMLPDGSVRIVGAPEVEGVITRLNNLYSQQNPGTKFTYEKANSAAAIYSLMFDASAFAPITTYFGGSATYGDVAHGPAFSVRIAHASLKPGAKLSPYVVIVNFANSKQQISVSELTQIFTQPMRQRVLTQWNQAGDKSAFGATAIAPSGLPWSDHYASEDVNFADEFFTRKLGGAPPVQSYRGFKTYAQVVSFVAETPGAIGIVPASRVAANVKVLGVTETLYGRPQTATAEEIAAGHYPLDRFVFINAHAVTGKPLDPLVLAYLRLVLSRDGQAAIGAEDAGFVPLSETERQEELAKFD